MIKSFNRGDTLVRLQEIPGLARNDSMWEMSPRARSGVHTIFVRDVETFYIELLTGMTEMQSKTKPQGPFLVRLSERRFPF